MATFTFSDNVGISGYGVNQSNTEEPSYTETSNTSITWTASSAGTYYIWVKDTVGNKSNTSFTIVSTAFCAYNAGQTWNYGYTGGVQSFSTPCNGTYKLEVWGAQGGSTVQGGIGGYGGYSNGTIVLNNNSTIYVVVGGIGSIAKTGNDYTISYANGGYNGGGGAIGSGGYNAASGGGATHIGTRNGTLAQYGNTTGLYIVAGGGGGARLNASGGAGGGLYGGAGGTGNAANSGGGGTQSYAGSLGGFGYAGGMSYNADKGGSGGGGGLYGGAGGWDLSGGGGSGYIGGVSGGSMQNGVRTGNGYARITLTSLSN